MPIEQTLVKVYATWSLIIHDFRLFLFPNSTSGSDIYQFDEYPTEEDFRDRQVLERTDKLAKEKKAVLNSIHLLKTQKKIVQAGVVGVWDDVTQRVRDVLEEKGTDEDSVHHLLLEHHLLLKHHQPLRHPPPTSPCGILHRPASSFTSNSVYLLRCQRLQRAA
ncbi:uncharacterized protein RCC_09489 [Ramularia collo-cygni]|uniref:Uncharacterized protein n=1 Tax=Ramularia collo-cygni TaxID=112498 RepID=A0A2D3VDD8_9PEZI|nr:uncharacterized protein RCC_09489 [Ramularia collo-cygni]CZT23775.1 uncharacterized protein RCC_09489 [Ramularia collo-cygni]